VAVALVVGVLAGAIAFAYQVSTVAPPDFIYPWRAARIFAAGQNPYTVLSGGLAVPFEAPLLYPFPAVMVALPVAWLGLPWAVGIFVGFSVSLLTYAITKDNWDALPFLASGPMLMAIILGQWSPVLVAGTLLPAGGFLAVVKPNIGLALTAYRPTRLGIVGGALFLGVSVMLLPSWPSDWLRSLVLDRMSGTHSAPITAPAGFLLALALLRWRRPEARLLLAMACVPQLLFFYDQVPLMLIPRTRNERYSLIFSSGIALLTWLALGHGTTQAPRVAAWCVIAGIYIPCLVMILARPNEGAVPAWIERRIVRFRSRLVRVRERVQ
jgi:hypothetical protein